MHSIQATQSVDFCPAFSGGKKIRNEDEISSPLEGA